MLKAIDIKKRYSDKVVLEKISFSLPNRGLVLLTRNNFSTYWAVWTHLTTEKSSSMVEPFPKEKEIYETIAQKTSVSSSKTTICSLR